MDSHMVSPGFFAVGLGLHVPEHDLLVLSDLHLGYEEALNRQGVLVPRFQYRDLIGYVGGLLDEIKPGKVLINGDLKHDFGSITRQEWSEVVGFLDFLSSYEVLLVKGNHDTVIGPVAGKGGLKVVEQIKLGTTLFLHGHELPEESNDVKTIVIGHEHPCIGLAEGGRLELVKCFLVGSFQGKDLIVLPSLNLLTEGVDVLREELLSPLLAEGVGDFRAYAVEGGEVLDFGLVKELI